MPGRIEKIVFISYRRTIIRQVGIPISVVIFEQCVTLSAGVEGR
jgi:hypothetical protein